MRQHTPSSPTQRALPYMPGLDGLRAVAVLAVFLYHTGFAWAAGGYLGVETFFVLSGYLITALLLHDLTIYRRLRLGRFWLRRARRLWPALWLLLVTLIFLTWWLQPDVWRALHRDLPFAFTYTINLAYILRHIPYFARAGRPPVLQHLWSLAVEEQFYLFWPLMLWGMAALLGAPRHIKRQPWLAVPTVALALGSTLWMAALAHPLAESSRLYYATDTRAAGFLLGGALAILWPPQKTRHTPPRYAAILTGIGGIGIAVLLWLYHTLDEFQPWLYRGGFLLTDFATIAAIAGSTLPDTTLEKILGHPIPRWIGARSYAIYLWHWPWMVFFRPGIEVKVALPWYAVGTFALTALCAELSYRLIEHPIRTQGFRAWGRTLWQVGHGWGTVAMVTSGLLAIGVATFSLEQHTSHPSKLAIALASEATQAAALAANIPTPISSPPSSTLATASPTTSLTPSVTTPKSTDTPPSPTPTGLRITLLGDSIMLGTFPAWQRSLPRDAFYMDAAQNRQMAAMLNRVPYLGERGKIAPIVVIHLGTNGAFTAQTFRAVVDRLTENGAREIYFVNIRSPIRWAPLVNQRLRTFTSHTAHTHLLDWNAYATPHPEWFFEDFAHLNPQGATAYVQFILERTGLYTPPADASLASTAFPTITATATVTPSPPPVSLRLTLLGDSVMASSISTWWKTLPPGSFYINAVPNRRVEALEDLLPQLAHQHKIAPMVVIHLGNNGGFYRSLFRWTVNYLLQHGAQQIYFVNVRIPSHYATLINQRLEEFAAEYPQVHVLDWNAYATPHPEWFKEDFIHLSVPAGARAYVNFILTNTGLQTTTSP